MKAEAVVIDTNVLISAALIKTSLTAVLVRHCMVNHQILFSDETFDELKTRLWRPKFDRYLSIENRNQVVLEWLATGSWIEIPPENAVRKFSRDADDDKFLQLASAGRSHLLVSGDRDLLDLKVVDGIEIITPAQAFKRWLG